jgi:hypothetical protein
MTDLWGTVLAMSGELKRTAQMRRDTNEVNDQEAAETLAGVDAKKRRSQRSR